MQRYIYEICADSRSPRGERGLKYSTGKQLLTACCRSPRGERGLKSVGRTWMRSDGEQFCGPMASPLQDPAILQMAQDEYVRANDTIAQLDAAVIELEYQNVLLEMGVSTNAV
ncbi:MAG: hypothetical protein RRZ24_11285 [Clostridia bacterium]